MVDPDFEQKMAVGMVIRSDQFPDKLFAPAKRSDLMADGVNPIFDKEMRSELFGQGTLMLRLVIQLSMFLALPLMAVCLYIRPTCAPWYTCYIVLFNVLVGPVFSAGSVTSERERQTLELLLTTTVSPWHILTGKLISGLRVSCVLTAFIIWPLLLAWLLPPWTYWFDSLTIIRYLVDHRPDVADDDHAGHVLLGDFFADEREPDDDIRHSPVALRGAGGGWIFAKEFSPSMRGALVAGRIVTGWDSPFTWLQWSTSTSPIAAAFSLPLTLGDVKNQAPGGGFFWQHAASAFIAFYVLLDAFLLGTMLWLFHRRWRVWS